MSTARCRQCAQLLIVVAVPLARYKLVAEIDATELRALTAMSAARMLVHLQSTAVHR